MKKRILSIVLSIVMLVSLLPTTALAMPSSSDYSAWSDGETLFDGTYDLGGETITITGPLVIAGTVTVQNGTIQRGSEYAGGEMFFVNAGKSLTLDGVTIDGGAVWCGAVDDVLKRGTTNIGATSSSELIYVGMESTAVLTNCVLQNNECSDSGGGGAISVDSKGSLTATNTTMCNNAKTQGQAGAIKAYTGATVNLTGCTLYGNEAVTHGGAVQIWGGNSPGNIVHMTMTDCTVRNNKAGGVGGGIAVSDYSDFTMIGGTITDNATSDSSKRGGGVGFSDKNTTMSISDNAVISGNVAKADVNNLYVGDNDCNILAVADMGGRASVGVTMASAGVFSSGGASYAAQFKSDNAAYEVAADGSGNLQLVAASTITYTVTYRSSANSEKLGSVKVAAGEYTLPACTFTPPSDKQFAGWAYAADGEVISDAVITVSADTTLYAIWETAPALPHAHDMSVDCGGSGVTFEAWDGTGTPTGNVYLTGDVTLADTLTISGTVNLCLKGHSITNSATAAIIVNSGATLNICDCIGGGSVTNSGGTNLGGTTYGIYNSGTVNVYGGTISATTTATTTTAGSGSGIYNYSGQVTVVGTGAVVSGTLYGIYNNSTNGTVSVSAGKVSGKYGIYNKGKVIVGGEIEVTGTECGISNSGTVSISGGTVQATGSSGHGIYSTGGTVSVSGGTVQATGSNGRGIYNSGGAVSVSDGTVSGLTYGVYASGTGDITISGGEVSARNSASNSNSYGVYRLGSGAVEITGGTVSGKNGVYLYGSGNVTVSGGTVTGNGTVTGTVTGNGIYLHSSSTGAVSVSGGTVSGTVYGVCTTGGSSGSVTVSGVANISGAQSGILHYGTGSVTVSGGTVQSPQRVTGTTSSGIKIITGSGNVSVSGGTVSGMDYGIYNGGTLTLSNAPTITGDTADIHLDSGKIITISGALTYTEENAISVKMDSAGTFTSGWTDEMGENADNYGSYFTSANDGYIVAADGNNELELAPISVTDVSLDKSSLTLDVGGTATLTATVLPDDATDKSVSWESSDPTVAKVENGLVTALKPGSTTITATTTDGGFTATCTVKVNAKALSASNVTLDVSSFTYDGAEKKPTVTVKDGDTVLAEGTDYTVSYSDNTNAGTGKVTVTFTGNYSGRAEKSFTISKANQGVFAITGKPTGDIAYGDSFTLSTTGGSGGGAVSWAVTSGDAYAEIDSTGKVTIKGVGEVTITATKAESANYNVASDAYTFTSVKATPTYTMPANLTATYGQTLANVSLTNGWSWVNDSQSVGAVGRKSFDATFTPSDTVNYKTVEVKLTVTVGKATPTVVAPAAKNSITYGAKLSEVGLTDGWAWVDGNTVPTVQNTGFKAYYTPGDTSNYDWTQVEGWNATENRLECTVSVTVNKQKVTKPTENAETFTYNGTAQTYMVTASTLYEISNETQTNAGSYTVIVALKDSANYEWTDGTTAVLEYTFKIEKKELGIAWSNTALAYNGAAQRPTATATGVVTGEQIALLLSAPETNAGSYTATVHSIDGATAQNYKLPTNKSTSFTIEQQALTILWGNGTFTYDSTEKFPAFNVEGIWNADDVQVTKEGAQTNAGEYTAQIIGLTGSDAGNYKLTGTLTKDFVINKADQAAPAVNKADETISGKNDGKITDVTSAMEYRKDGTDTYTNIVGVEIAGLADGTYYVRYAETENRLASDVVTVVIAAGKKVTVTFAVDGGNAIESIKDLAYGDKVTAPTEPKKAGYTFAGWFSDSDCTKAWNFGTDTVTANLTLYAKWSDVPVYHISGKVEQETDVENVTTPVANATVKLMLGDKLIDTTTTDGNGNYSFAKQEAGHYNVVVTNGAQTVTVLIELTKDTANEVVLPASVTNSIVKHEPAGNGKDSIAAGTLVGGLEDVAAAVRSENQNAQKVEVKLTVADQPPVTGTPSSGSNNEKVQKQQKAIQQKAGGKQLVFFDLSVVKTIDNGTPEAITDTGAKLLEIRIPFDSGNKWGITIYRYHGDKAEALAAVREGSTTEGFWVGDDGYIHIYTHKFSTYAVGYTVPSYGYFVPVTPDTVTSADTFDAGIVVYVTMSMLAATGSAVVIGKKRKEEN